MEIVINISEEEYNKIKENDMGFYNGRFFQMIRNGIPLPKKKMLYASCLNGFPDRLQKVSHTASHVGTLNGEGGYSADIIII